jgi:hypothetical protein
VEKALEMAKEKFKNERNERLYGSSYWENLEAEVLSKDVSVPFVSGIYD